MNLEDYVEVKRFLQTIGAEVASDFARDRTILSFEEYLNWFLQHPRHQARNAAQYLLDMMDHFGVEDVPHPTGKIRRFKLFDLIDGDRDSRVAGQEEVQNAVYRAISNFTRAGRINKLIFLHGPNGSAKSTIIQALQRGMEHYSRASEGALYKINWIFPADKLIKGSIGFSERLSTHGDLATFAHLEAENVDVQIACEMKDHPLLAIPKQQRQKLLAENLKGVVAGRDDFVLSEYLLQGELCNKCRRIYTALLTAHGGDYLRVLRYIQVQRFYVSRRYQVAAVTVEPQMSVDAAYQLVSADRSALNLPSALHNIVLYGPHGALVSANRGLLEYSDLLKRPLEAFKYLLGTSETGEVPLDHFLLQLDEVLVASSNEKHLGAFKELPDFASFKGRIELVRVPYLRRYRVEQQIYEAQVTGTTVGRHVAPHAAEVAASWAVLTRLKKPIPDRYPVDLRQILDHLTPLEKMHLYQEGNAPDRLTLAQAKELKKATSSVYEEADAYPNYEGRSGASAREIKTALLNAAQNPKYRCLHALAVLEELEALCKDKTIYEFLQQEVVDAYHDHEDFVKVVEGEYLDRVDHEVRDSMGLVSEQQYQELFERYIQHVSHWLKGERMRNRITGELEKPDEARMLEMEAMIMPKGEDSGEFRRALISQIGAHKLDHPDAEMQYAHIFPDLFKHLRSHFFEERKRVLWKNKENILKYLSDDRPSLSLKEADQVQNTLKNMNGRYGYCENCAKDAILFLMRKRYAS